MSTRAEILKVLCNKEIFPVNENYFYKDIVDIVIPRLSPDTIANVADIEHSIRQALETIDGYNYSNGTRTVLRRDVIKEKCFSNTDSDKYYIRYTFL